MRRMLLVLMGLLLLSKVASAQNCNTIVLDQANVLSNRIGLIEASGDKLINAGADLHVLTVAHTDNLDNDEDRIEKICPSWRAPNGVRKNTLIVLALAPNDRKMGIYYGAAWHKALDNDMTRIKQDYMAPYFKNGDWATGFIASAQQIAARIASETDEARHPVVASTTNIVNTAPEDYSGLWTVLGWMIFLICACLGIWGILALIVSKKKKEELVNNAQMKAEKQKIEAADYLNDLADRLKIPDPALKNEDIIKAKKYLDQASEKFAKLASSIINDPSEGGKTVEEYNSIEDSYKSVSNLLLKGHEALYPSSIDIHEQQLPPKPPVSHKNKKPAEVSEEIASKANTTVTHSDTTFIPVPIIVEEHHSYHSSDDSSSSSSSDFGGGGSSSFGGGDSGGGGSSSF